VKRNKLYLFILSAAAIGYIWLCWNYNNYNTQRAVSGINICLFKRITGLPCPSCGTTRSVLSISHMHLADALYYNPIGFIIALGLGLLPVWVLADTISSKSSFHKFYMNAEIVVRKKWVAAFLILLVAGNWIWNIYKYTAQA
jgi:hypothetical protein